jgi:hypothetical protein
MILKGLKPNRHAFIVLLEFVIDSDRNTRSRYDFNANANDLSYGFKGSRLAWYSIDPIFYTQNLGISNDDLSIIPLGESTVKSFIL